MIKLIFALMLISTNALAEDQWTRADTYREATFQVLNVIDWGQTRYIAQHPDQFYEAESAWLIGKHPDEKRVNIYMAETTIIHYAITRALLYFNLRYIATPFQYTTIGMKLNNAIGNVSIGIKVSF